MIKDGVMDEGRNSFYIHSGTKTMESGDNKYIIEHVIILCYT